MAASTLRMFITSGILGVLVLCDGVPPRPGEPAMRENKRAAGVERLSEGIVSIDYVIICLQLQIRRFRRLQNSIQYVCVARLQEYRLTLR